VDISSLQAEQNSLFIFYLEKNVPLGKPGPVTFLGTETTDPLPHSRPFARSDRSGDHSRHTTATFVLPSALSTVMQQPLYL